MSNRQGEDQKTFFRSDRFFTEGGQWYFSTRENTIEGPFSNREEAEQELMLYVRRLEEREKFGLKP